MRAFGYEVGDAWELGLDKDEAGPISLREVSLCCSPDQLRVLAKFFLHVADLIEKHGGDFGHEHLQYWWQDWRKGFVDVIVVRERAET